MSTVKKNPKPTYHKMSDLKVGDSKKLTRTTFLFEGIFVHKDSTVKILEINGDEIAVEFTDMEGYKHRLDGVKPAELE